jgi:hypothetical protein
MNPPDNPIADTSTSTEENAIEIQMDEPPKPIVKDFSGFMFYVVLFGCAILLWSLTWVGINAITLKMGFASPFAMRVVWSLPLLGVLGTLLSGRYPTAWLISIFVIGFLILGASLIIAGLFGLYSTVRQIPPLVLVQVR